MGISFTYILIVVAILFIVSIFASKLSDRLGVPILLVFLAIGMLAGSEGLGKINFDNPLLAQDIGTATLIIILFSGGLDTHWDSARSVFKEGFLLATLGVALTTLFFGLCAWLILKIDLIEALLIGAIISSTDAAAVFSILRSRGVNLKERLSPLLELESGSNDPMAVLLTITLVSFVNHTNSSIISTINSLLLQLIVGALIGWVMSKVANFIINHIKLRYEGLYPILSLALAFFAFGLSTLLKGSGFLTVYLFGLLLGKEEFVHRHSTLRFFDTSAWFSQIVLFITLGLLVFPSHLLPVMAPGLGLALLLVFLVRPAAVFISMIPFKYSWREKLFISWVGLRGAVPIVLATYPLVAGITHAPLIFNIIFFVVVISVLLQGTLLPQVAHLLKVESSSPPSRKPPIEIITGEKIPGNLKELIIPADSQVVNKAIYELGLPPGYLIVLISRGTEFIQPNGNTVLQAGDSLLALTDEEALSTVQNLLAQPAQTKLD